MGALFGSLLRASVIFSLLLGCGTATAEREDDRAASVTIAEQPEFTAQRQGRFAIVELKVPHRVLSTSRTQGGQTDDINFLVNYQSMEASGDLVRFEKQLSTSAEQYHADVANQLNLNPDRMALMGTAASVNRMAHVTREFRDLRVDAFVTAGVAGNATRASDPADWFQGANGKEFVPYKGTINTILLINKPLTPGAQAKSVMVMVEAKAAALAELAVASKVSSHLATGTGTDQYLVAAPLVENVVPLKSASSHVKLGQLIGAAVRAATLEALRWQNGLEPSVTGNVIYALGRFGLSEETLFSGLQQHLLEPELTLLKKNNQSVINDPRVVAASYAYAAVLDRMKYGSLPQSLASEYLRDQAASVAVALSMKPHLWPAFWSDLQLKEGDLTAPFVQAIALGWSAKWQE